MHDLIQTLRELQAVEVAFTELYEFEMARGELHIAIDCWSQIYEECLKHLKTHSNKATPAMNALSESYDIALKLGNLELAAKAKCMMITISMRMAEDWQFAREHLARFEQEAFEMTHEELLLQISKTPWLLLPGAIPEHRTLH